jgi:hypothetical protein
LCCSGFPTEVALRGSLFALGSVLQQGKAPLATENAPVNIQIPVSDVQFKRLSIKKEIPNQMLICQACGCKPNQQLVCKECYDEMVTRMGDEIRALQSEVLGLHASAKLFGGMAKAAVSKYRESRTPSNSDSVAEVINLLKDKQL